MTIKPDLSVPIPDRLDRLHFVGIGGSGMSGIARMFLARGAEVSGSDRGRNANTDVLSDLGATITIGHDIDTFRRIEFIRMFPRGVEWAATGEVRLQGPDRRGERRFLPWPYYTGVG